jgi:hypothetical protein
MNHGHFCPGFKWHSNFGQFYVWDSNDIKITDHSVPCKKLVILQLGMPVIQKVTLSTQTWSRACWIFNLDQTSGLEPVEVQFVEMGGIGLNKLETDGLELNKLETD